jgi:hypothetical protein
VLIHERSNRAISATRKGKAAFRARHSVAVAGIRRRARAMSSDDRARESDDGDARARARPSGSTHRKRTESRYLSAEADVFAHLTPTDASSTSLEDTLGEPSPSG